MNINNSLLNFTLGLLMGNGSFQINHWKKKYLQYRIIIKLKYHIYNLKMLQNIRDSFNIGNINVNNKFVLWIINDKKQILYFINLIINKSILKISTKQYLKILKMKYGIINNISYSEYHFLEEKNSWTFSLSINNNIDLLSEEYKWWLCGFVEAEGCFCIRKNKNLSFSIGQKNNLVLINLIKLFFNLPNKLREKENFFIIETYNKKSIIKIIEFFNNYNLKGEKKESFELFKIAFNEKK